MAILALPSLAWFQKMFYLTCHKCRTRFAEHLATYRQTRAVLCHRHWRELVAKSRRRSNAALRRSHADIRAQSSKALAQVVLRQVAAHGRWSDPRCIFVSKSNHWVNSSPHVPVDKGGEAVAGLATLCTCQIIICWHGGLMITFWHGGQMIIFWHGRQMIIFWHGG